MSTKQSRPAGGMDYSNFFQNFKMPGMGVNFDTIMASHRKNMDTINMAQQTASEVFRGLMHLNTQYWKNMFEDVGSSGRTMMGTDTHEEKLKHQTNAVKGFSDKTWNHSRKVNDMLNQSTSKVMDIYSKRFQECMEESKEMAKNAPTETIKV